VSEEQASVHGREAIMRLFGLSDWRSVESMAERDIDPLPLYWDAFARPWLDRAEVDTWLRRNNRGHRYMRIERAIRRSPALMAQLGDLLPEQVRRRGRAA